MRTFASSVLARRLGLFGVSALVLASACSSEDGSCGSEGVSAGEVVVAASASSGPTLRFHQLSAGANNDCPDPAAPAQVISLTIAGVSLDGRQPLTLCVPRPDLLRGTRALGVDVQVIDVTGADASCSYRLARPSAPSGQVSASGVCDNGRDPAGFALQFDGAVSIERTCGAVRDTLAMTMTGIVAVAGSQ
jgi:hypothetical protein